MNSGCYDWGWCKRLSRGRLRPVPDGLPKCSRVDMEILSVKFVEGCIMSGYKLESWKLFNISHFVAPAALCYPKFSITGEKFAIEVGVNFFSRVYFKVDNFKFIRIAEGEAFF